jgi:hypothetical protein
VLQFCLRICHKESPRKSSQFGIEWDTSGIEINLMGDNINAIKQNTETLLGASRDVGLEINVEETRDMIISHHQNSGQNQNIRTGNESFGNMAKLKYLGMTQIRMTFMMKSRSD